HLRNPPFVASTSRIKSKPCRVKFSRLGSARGRRGGFPDRGVRTPARRALRRRPAGLAGARLLVSARPAALRGGLPRLLLPGLESLWALEAPQELLSTVAPIQRYAYEQTDCLIHVEAPENTRDGSNVSPERMALVRKARRPLFEAFASDSKPWVGCQYPTPALAQDAGMTLADFTEFLFGAVLVDWDEAEREMGRIA